MLAASLRARDHACRSRYRNRTTEVLEGVSVRVGVHPLEQPEHRDFLLENEVVREPDE